MRGFIRSAQAIASRAGFALRCSLSPEGERAGVRGFIRSSQVIRFTLGEDRERVTVFDAARGLAPLV